MNASPTPFTGRRRRRGNCSVQSARIERERENEHGGGEDAFVRRVTLHRKALLSTAETRFKARLPLKLPRTKLSPRHPQPDSSLFPLFLFSFFFLSPPPPVAKKWHSPGGRKKQTTLKRETNTRDTCSFY